MIGGDLFRELSSKSTEQAVGRVLLHREAAKTTGDEAAVFVVDIDKCYENVQHDHLRRAALQHGFPLPIVILCINMYRARRTVAWGGVFVNTAISGQTLVPLQLLMITPLDEYCFNLPMQVKIPEVYVDDAIVTVVASRHLIEDITVKAAEGLVGAFELRAGLPAS